MEACCGWHNNSCVRRGPVVAAVGPRRAVALALTLASLSSSALAQRSNTVPRTETRPAAEVAIEKIDLSGAVQKGAAHLLLMQERGEGQPDGTPACEWPYEGVYRAEGKLPIGYRVGGTAIVVTALVRAPGFAADTRRVGAVAEGVRFICAQTAHPLMSFEDYDAGYDVRGWGYTYGLLCLCELQTQGLVPDGQQKQVAAAMRFFADAIEATQIPKVGGWNYARPAGRAKPAAPSTFMTPPTVQALFAARACGVRVNPETVSNALKFMEASIAGDGQSAGSVTYSGPANPKQPEPVPGAIGRMCVTEATLAMAGRSSAARLERAVRAFVEHWDELDKRRQRTGTHEGKYAVAPYYFMFAHYAASQAVAMLPTVKDKAANVDTNAKTKAEANAEHNAALGAERSAPELARLRAELVAKCSTLLFRVQADDGSWNDRIFARSSGYGTAMAMMSIEGPRTWTWADDAAEPKNGGPESVEPDAGHKPGAAAEK